MKLQCARFSFVSNTVFVGFAVCLNLLLTLNLQGTDASHKIDFDRDGKTDISVYHPGGAISWLHPSYFYVLSSQTNQVITYQWGRGYDNPIPADYDNDGKTDVAIFRSWDPSLPNPMTNQYWINYSGGGGYSPIYFGGGKFVSRNYFDDAIAEIAVFKEYDVSEDPQKPCYISAYFVRVPVSETYLRKDVIDTCTNVSFRIRPAPGDYNNDGKSDVAALIIPATNPSTSYFAVWYSPFVPFEYTSPDTTQLLDVQRPIPGDYDGDGIDDFAGIKIVNGTRLWRIKKSSLSEIFELTFGFDTDLPVPGDYDGDGKTDIGIFRPSNSTWYIIRSFDNELFSQVFGLGTDIPLPQANW